MYYNVSEYKNAELNNQNVNQNQTFPCQKLTFVILKMRSLQKINCIHDKNWHI